MSAIAGLGALAGRPPGLAGSVQAAVDPSRVQTGWIGMITFLLLATATWLLIRSFRKQMRKVDQAGLPHEEPRPHGPRPGLRLPVDDSAPVDEHRRRDDG
jgi:hypothetical protein